MTAKRTWVSMVGMMLAGIGFAGLQGETWGGLAVLGMWLIWEDMRHSWPTDVSER